VGDARVGEDADRVLAAAVGTAVDGAVVLDRKSVV
jgi:hypothetical protein